MKQINLFKYFRAPLIMLACFSLSVSGCKKTFLDGTPDDQLTVDNYYTTAQQVLSATAGLYGYTWFYFNEKFSIGVGDVYAGNSWSDFTDCLQFTRFSVTQNNMFISEGWGSLYVTIANANSIINRMPEKATGSVDETTIKRALGEARFIRAMAYFYLVRVWGEVPIITDGSKMLNDYKVKRIVVEDVYRFIREDLQYAEANLPDVQSDKGRVSAGAAKALLAKVYLQMKDYTNAKLKAAEIIANKAKYGYGLMDNYADLFYTANDNNKESIFAFQWLACQTYGTGNVHQAYFAPYGQGLTGFGDGWGTFVPTISIQQEFETGDLRIKPTMFLTDNFYPNLKSKTGGYTYTSAAANSSRTKANIKKYVVGLPDDNTAGGCFMSTAINTYVIRYADVLLTYAEAVLGTAAVTSDATALSALNEVRRRANLGDKASITIDDILHERRVEFAFEGQYWYDLLRLDRTKAKQIISAQERGTYSSTGISSYFVSPTDNAFVLPIPQTDTDRNPNLLEPAVKFY